MPARTTDRLTATWSLAPDGTSTLVPTAGPPAAEPPPLPARIADRYERRELLGRGASGEVWRVTDTLLQRPVALKVLHRPSSPSVWARFEEEARLAARLQHPGIVPVHDLGRLDDGRLWFTMREVQGASLEEVLHALHGGHAEWTFRRLLDAFLQACRALGYAHTNGIVHRDVKPANIMLGDHGEVLVVDWGLAYLHAASVAPKPQRRVFGTPLYMAPEQASGHSDDAGPTADVYALAATLYHLLTGSPPRSTADTLALVNQVAAGAPPIPPPSTRSPLFPVDPELDELLLTALSHDPGDRPADASRFADALDAWADDQRRRDAALGLVEEARVRLSDADALDTRATVLRAEGAEQLAQLEGWRPEEDKAPAWARLDRGEAIALDAERARVDADRLLHAALRVAPALPEAVALLIERARQGFQEAERSGDMRASLRHRAVLEAHLDDLPPTHPVRRTTLTFLEGTGTLDLITEPSGARVQLVQQVVVNRRRVDGPVVELGVTPLRSVPVAMGSYVARLHHPDCDPVAYPVHIVRQGHWHGRPPGGDRPEPIVLPPRGSLPPDTVLVPAGWFQYGDDEATHALPPGETWCPAFVVDRFPVTNARYLGFLNDLVDRGLPEEAERWVPRPRSGAPGSTGAPVFQRMADGTWKLGRDAEGHLWLPDRPVVLVDRSCASAYAAWRAERTGLPWRLPVSLELEKAARGVDGRAYPWGDHVDPSWSCSGASHRSEREPVSVDAFPVDCSVYGVRGLAGNVLALCADTYDPRAVPGDRVQIPTHSPGPIFVARGGSWASPAVRGHAAARARMEDHRSTIAGFRTVYTYAPPVQGV